MDIVTLLIADTQKYLFYSKLFFSWLAMLLDDIILINNLFYHAGAYGSQTPPVERGSQLMAGVSRQRTSVNEVIKIKKEEKQTAREGNFVFIVGRWEGREEGSRTNSMLKY